MRKKVKLALLISLLLSTSALANAQFSLKPKPLPDCKTFLISEVGVFYRITSAPEGLMKYSDYLVSNMGLMVNLNKNYSLGATTYVSMKNLGDPMFSVGLKAKGRRWLDSNKSINLAGGIILYNESRPYKSPAFSGDIGFNINDLFIIEVLMEVIPYDFYRYEYSELEGKMVRTIRFKGSDLGIYTGIKTGSLPGLAVNLLAAVVGGILYIVVRG